MTLKLTHSSEMDEENDLDQWIDEVDMMEQDDERCQLTSQVLNEIGLSHLIIYDTFNLCELSAVNQLGKFNLKMLKEIFQHLEIHFKSKDTKKMFLEKLNGELRKCECRL